MTREQVEWLRKNPRYQIVARPATGVTYAAQGYVLPSGEFVRKPAPPTSRRAPMRTPVDGEVLVGVKEFNKPAGAETAREYNER